MFIKTNLLIFYRKSGKKWLSCMSIMLLLLSMFPAAALGAVPNEVAIDVTNPASLGTSLNASDVSEKGVTIDFTLGGGNLWNKSISKNVAGAIEANLYPVLKSGFNTTGSAIQWGSLLDSATFVSSGPVSDVSGVVGFSTITMKIPKPAQPYNIQTDQAITFAPPKTMLKNMDVVDPAILANFTINADYATISGSLNGAKESEIISGGKQLIIQLNGNCEWNFTTTHAAIDDLFLGTDSGLSVSGNEPAEWTADVYNALLLVNDPIAVSPDKTKLTITLPVVPNYSISGPQTISWDRLKPSLINHKGGASAYTVPLNVNKNSFTINPDVGKTNTISLVTTSSELKESFIKAAGTVLTLTLNDNKWVSDIDSVLAKKTALLNGIIASTDVEAWNKVKGTVSILKTDDNILKITIPVAANYSISTDQLVTIDVPSTLLDNNQPLSNKVSFTIKANPSVAISGSLTAGVTEMDILKGGKDIVATLYNATWRPTVTTTEREALINGLLAGFPADKLPTIKAGATFTLNNSNTVTVKLPPVPEFTIAGPLTITPDIGSLEDLTSIPTITFDNASTSTSFKIIKVSNQSASISGTVTTATESDIVTGDKTLVITLENDIWALDVESKAVEFSSLFSSLGMTTPFASTEIVRTSDSVLTITLPPVPGYNLEDLDKTIQVKIPQITMLNYDGLDDIEAGSFIIKAVTATVSGTAVTAALNSKFVTTGGKTIVITLKNATWASDVLTSTAKFNALKGCFTTDTTTALTKWPEIENLITAKDITLKGNNVLTIKLPPVGNFLEPSSQEVVKFSMSESALQKLINEKLGKILTDPTNKVRIGEITVTAALSGLLLDVPNVVAGKTSISITLTGGTWDPQLMTTSSKVSTLVSGFKSDSDSASWAMVQKALKGASPVNFVLTSNNQTLTITLPVVPGYDPVKNQIIGLTIPKALIIGSTANVIAKESIEIKVQSYAPQGSLTTLLANDGFANLISTVPLQNIFLIVPKKFITSVVIKRSDIENSTLNSLDIYTDAKVKSVKVEVNGKEYPGGTPISKGSEKVFNVGFVTVKATDATVLPDVTITVLEVEGTTEFVSQVKIKLAGSKTYKYAPTTDLSGSYSLYKLMDNPSLMKNVLKYYPPADGELKVETKS